MAQEYYYINTFKGYLEVEGDINHFKKIYCTKKKRIVWFNIYFLYYIISESK